MSPDIPQTLFSAGVLLASYLTYRCQQPPNPNPSAAKQSNADPFTRTKFTRLIAYQGTLFLLLGTIHALLPLLPPQPHASVCPAQNTLNPSLFTWSPRSTILLTLTVLGGTLRLLSFAHLSQNFTFAVARPSRLITSGVYAYIQHPGYTGGILALAGFSRLVLRTDGVFACWSGTKLWSCIWVFVYANKAFVEVFVFWVVFVRVPSEERMLRDAFGAEWEGYHARTARFVPWVL
ncbi:methyltransferase family protein [Aspergillus mulundensis]|uniref:Protein-S-isoprenylcysteine O-methyltransferase n=1 Tax=Aspergillus mulundensis TaxID=1810919 RepID=A0A3D8SL30_9EURO|nr:hypothetical protein DSM5745_03655 [Aspergillus mulundensis]RDW87013.1 hypothetical protein DSM5745_03655 [Aspergillus mulundensis]